MHTTPPIIVGTGFKAKKIWAKKKPPAMPKGTAGKVLLNAHQLRALVIPHPDLLWAGIAYAEVIAFKEIQEILSSFPISNHRFSGFVIPPVGGQGMNVSECRSHSKYSDIMK
jgi:hypothetical protein